jgi:2'-5' RNA ligase
MLPPPNGADRVNSFAVVTYIPGRLGSFLDQLRRELEPATLAPRAHVTVVPPRPLLPGVSPADAWGFLDKSAASFRPIEIRAAHVEVFPVTNVVYIGLSAGSPELIQMHDELNRGELQAVECFRFHPHITLAQGLTPEQAMEIAAHAQRRWNDFDGARGFLADTFTFVQNTVHNRWLDLAEFTLPQLVRSVR